MLISFNNINDFDSGNANYGGQYAKNIYLGDTRIVTKLNSKSASTYQEEYYKQYYYHSDHLGSVSLISDYKGDEYQRLEYTPYGEIWVEKKRQHRNRILALQIHRQRNGRRNRPLLLRCPLPRPKVQPVDKHRHGIGRIYPGGRQSNR